MTISLLLDPALRTTAMWLDQLRAALPEEPVELFTDATDRTHVDVALVRGLNPGDLGSLPNLGLIQCLWAGVDRLLHDPAVPTEPLLVRTVDPAMANQMAATAVAHVLDAALGHHGYRQAQQRAEWKPRHCKPMSSKTVGILGFGALGRRCAELLSPFGFQLIGLRSSAANPGGSVSTTNSMADVLHVADIVINLLPLTDATTGVLNAAAFASMRQGAVLINLARGGHVVDADLLAALDSGHLGRAVLDVFQREPLPADHPFWLHPFITVTPHVAAETDPHTAAAVIAENIRAYRRNDPTGIVGLVDRAKGY